MDRRCMQCARWCGVPRAPLHSLMPRRQIKSISAPVPHLTVPSCRHSTPPPLRLSSVCYWVRPDVVGCRRDRECRVARPAPSAHVMAGLRPPPLVPTFAPRQKGKTTKGNKCQSISATARFEYCVTMLCSKRHAEFPAVLPAWHAPQQTLARLLVHT